MFESSDDIKPRIACIKANKPEDEIETRLRLLKPIVGELPSELVQAYSDYKKASENLDRTWSDCLSASLRYAKLEGFCKFKKWFGCHKIALLFDRKLRAAYNTTVALGCVNYWTQVKEKEIDALHKQECPNCPWDGVTIFPNK